MRKLTCGFAARAVATMAFLIAGAASAATADYWHEAPRYKMPSGLSGPEQFRALTLDINGLNASLRRQQGSGITLSLPRPDVGFDDFILSDSGTMPAALAAKYPHIRSYSGVDAAGNHVRVDISPLGLNAMVFAKEGVWMVRPLKFGQGSDYIAFRRDTVPNASPMRCEVPGNQGGAAAGRPGSVLAQPTTTGLVKRSYRAAVVANHQWVQAYTGKSNPTVAEGLAGVVMAINRVNEVYATDFAIHLSLIANNDELIFPLAANDPFGDSSSNGGGALGQFTNRISGIVGSANYDIGHVFTTGSGGVAYLGAVCDNTYKGGGTTGLTNGALLSTDVFYIDYVSHEMGHQFGGNHTFNGSQGSCGGGNRNAGTAYEPGSGSTIMAYAGICGSNNNLQPHSDPYFHAASMDEINAYTTTDTGSTCGTATANHAAPVVLTPPGYTIPASTPFALAGSVTSSAPGAALSYVWEEYDLGSPNNNLANDPGDGPIMRSWNPAGATRYVPRLVDLFAGTNAFGEILPTTNRTLDFVETVRDNILGGGTSQSARSTLTVATSAGPFIVTGPAAGASWDYANATALVTWNVAGTDQAPVSCPLVDIDLTRSTDFDNPITLASAVPNNGSATVHIPNLATSSARVRVACANNVFFNVSPGDFTIIPGDVIFVDGFDVDHDLIFADGFELTP